MEIAPKWGPPYSKLNIVRRGEKILDYFKNESAAIKSNMPNEFKKQNVWNAFIYEHILMIWTDNKKMREKNVETWMQICHE